MDKNLPSGMYVKDDVIHIKEEFVNPKIKYCLEVMIVLRNVILDNRETPLTRDIIKDSIRDVQKLYPDKNQFEYLKVFDSILKAWTSEISDKLYLKEFEKFGYKIMKEYVGNRYDRGL